MYSLKQKITYTMIPLLFALVFSPAFVFAQTANTMYRDGASDYGSTRQQNVWGYHQQSSDLQQKITALPSVANPVVLMPVLFGVGIKDISPNFGDPRSGGRTHEGEDIMAVKGTPIVSPTAAVVLRVVTGASEGNAIYTANPGNETFVYMHLDRFGEGVATGTVLQQGSLIGYVGNTGNASGGAAHLHFEIHDPSGTPTNPFPRLTGEIPIAEKISDLTTILAQNVDPVPLAQLLVVNFRSTFTAALAANIALPQAITNALLLIPTTTTPGSAVPLPPGDLDIGSSGVLVTTLQNYLIQKATGSAATRLTDAGATGYFGTITKAALLEYQVAVGLSPASGYYGPETRAFIAAHPITTSPTPVPTVPTTPTTGGVTFSRNLYQGISGEDVRTLQKILNAKGFIVATSGSGSPGNETTYFGPATVAAVIKFQIAFTISPAVGYVGPLTRGVFSSLD